MSTQGHPNRKKSPAIIARKLSRYKEIYIRKITIKLRRDKSQTPPTPYKSYGGYYNALHYYDTDEDSSSYSEEVELAPGI